MAKRIVIDARIYGLRHAGIGRYVANLIHEIKNQKSKIKDEEFTLLVRKSDFERIHQNYGDFFSIIVVDAQHYSLKEQFLLPVVLLKIKPDLLHVPHFNAPIFWFGKTVITIHDLIKNYSKGHGTTTRNSFFYWIKYLAYRVVLWISIKRAIKIIVPSEYWRKELTEKYHLSVNKVAVTYEGVDDKLKVPSLKLKVLDKYKIKKPFVVYTGSLYPHKNVNRLVDAIKKINENKSAKLSLVIASARNVFFERFKKYVGDNNASDFVNLAGFIPDEEIAILYKKAECFAFPSLIEGFGLPGLEAMSVGLPVVSSNASCLPEVYDDAALYFDPLNVDDMARKIKILLSDKKLRGQLVKTGYERVRLFSWKKMAEKTLQIYSQIVFNSSR